MTGKQLMEIFVEGIPLTEKPAAVCIFNTCCALLAVVLYSHLSFVNVSM